MDQYRTTGVMDKVALQEVQKYLFRTRLDWVRWIAVAVIAGCALLALIARDWFDGGLYLFLAAFVFLLPRLIQRRYIKNQLARMRENSPEGVTRYESFFTVDGVVLRNLTIHGEASLRYESLSLAASTPNLFFVMSKSRQFFLVFKDCLTPEQQESFLPFLKERCPKLKIMR